MAVGTEARKPEGRPAPRRHARARRSRAASLTWWHEVLLVAVGYAIYTVIRDVVPSHRSRATANAADVEQLEHNLGIFHEKWLNHALAPHEWLAQFSDYWYATAHFVVTIGVAIWILWKHPRHARPLRIAWYSMNVFALFGYFFYPLAPPRLMPGFIDTIARYGIWGTSGENANADGASNPYAAMPSMHVGWSTWCALVICLLATRRWVKVLGVLYPLVTLLVIAATANHYFLDAVGGWIALALGLVLSRIMTGHSPLRPEPADPDPPAAPG